MERSGARYVALEETVIVFVESSNGMTLSNLAQHVAAPIRSLVAIASKTQVEVSECRLEPINGTDGPSHFRIRVDPEVIDEKPPPRSTFPTFLATDVDISTFLPAWIRNANANPVPVAVAESRSRTGSGPLQVVEVVNAAETLQRTGNQPNTDSSFAAKVKDELGATALNSRETRKVLHALNITELPLQKRLLDLANGLGGEFCLWFFDGQVDEWAFVASEVRNALSHGYPTKHEIEHDQGTLYGIYNVTLAIIRLRLLVDAGLPSDDQLVQILVKDQAYLRLLHQQVACWRDLAARIRQA